MEGTEYLYKLKTAPAAGPPPSDFELMSVMMQRVNLLEKILKSQAQELETKVTQTQTHNPWQKCLRMEI